MEKKAGQLIEERGYPIIPKKELKCVWMTAGLISYKLCKYELQCEKCPLDWELRNLSANSDMDSDTSVRRGNERFYYHFGHTWVKREGEGEVKIGLDHFIGSMIEGIQEVLLPLPKSEGVRGESLCQIIQDGGVLDIVFPVSGFILSVNARLRDQPELIIEDPFGEGFLLTMKPKNFQDDRQYLITGEMVFSWYQKEWERFKETIIPRLNKDRRLGMTLQDGRLMTKEVINLVGPGQWIQFLNRFLRDGESKLLP